MNNHNHKTILNFASLKISSFHYFYCFIHSYFDVKPLLYLFVPKKRVKIYLFVILIRKLTNEIYLLVGLSSTKRICKFPVRYESFTF